MSLSNSLRAFLTVEWLHCSGGRSSSLGQLWREGVGWMGTRRTRMGSKGRGKREDECKGGTDRDAEGEGGERRA